MILDSRIGALDRTLGFLFGLARGLVIVVVAFLFFDWLVPERSQPEWVQEREIARRAGKHRRSADVDAAGRPRGHILKRFKRRKDGDEPAEPAAAPQRGANASPPATTGTVPARANDEQKGYGRDERRGMQQLLDNAAPTRR